MNYLYLLVALVIIFLIIDKFAGKSSIQNEKTISFYEPNNDKNPTNIGFVKPEHKLLKILNNISNGDKIKLSGVCNHFIYNKNTITSDLNEKLTYLIKDIINSINKISSNDYYIKKIENVYCLIDRKKNQR